MSLARYANRRDASEPAIVEVLEAAGFHIEPMDKPVDLLVSRAGVWHLIECKSGKAGKLTQAQQDFIAAARAPVVVLRDAGEAVAWVKELGTHQKQSRR